MPVSDPKKPKMTLLPFKALQACAEVQAFGNSKPGRTELDWLAKDARDFVDAALRHIGADQYAVGTIDEESGLRHLAHAAQNLLLAVELLDDPMNPLVKETERLGLYKDREDSAPSGTPEESDDNCDCTACNYCIDNCPF